MGKGSRKEWEEDEVNYLKERYECTPAKEIAEELNRTVKSVYRKANRLGLKSKTTGIGGRLYSKEEIKYLKENYEDMSSKKIAKELDRSKHSVRKKANKLGLNRNINVFDESKTLDLSYILGVCFGDGTVGDYPKLGRYIIKLEVTDKTFAKSFRNSLSNIELNPSFWTSEVPNYKNEWIVLAYSKNLVKWFYDLGLDGTKKFLTSKNMERKFIKGIYDSEGTLCNYKNRDVKRSIISICMSNKSIVNFIDYLLENMGINFSLNKRETKKSRKDMYDLRSGSKKEITSFLDKIDSNIHRKSFDSYKEWHKGK